ncbi:response regulator transcription factor [Chrysiogenes arsenatis]|uniref:response regulator transcription factor n=1 Tax=Chrysiogenes arsenatis TaxID=309797 RepID=UPI0005590FAE|nr:response regulator [Chrysiogenes arsenatis]
MQTDTLSFYSKHLNVLYVEDEISVLKAAEKLLSLYFKNVETASNGKIALEKYQPALHHIVITDINMPIMNGLEFIRQIRKINPSQLIVVTSAHNEADYLCNLIALGVDFYLMKPFENEAIVNTLTKAGSKLFHEKRYAYMRQVIQQNGGLSQSKALLSTTIDTLSAMRDELVVDPMAIERVIESLGSIGGTLDYIDQLFVENIE